MAPSLLVGTDGGVYRSASGTLDDLEEVLASGSAFRVRVFEGLGVFAATLTGLYRSVDGGRTWAGLDVPRTEVDSVVASPDGTRLYAGTCPAHVYVSTDRGVTWDELTGFRDLPSRREWSVPRHGSRAHVRSLGVHPDAPERLVAGVEVGGVHVSDDGGRTWSERRTGLESGRRDGLQYDVHHCLVVGAEEYVVACGGGLYRTRDAGRSWTLLETGPERPYFRASFVHRDRLYAAAQTLPPTLPGEAGVSEREVDAVLLESSDGGDTFRAVPYPGAPVEYVDAWSVLDGRVLAGTTAGRVIVREDEGWRTLGRVPAWTRALAVAPCESVA